MSRSTDAYRTDVVGTDGSESTLRAAAPADATRRSTGDVLVVRTTG